MFLFDESNIKIFFKNLINKFYRKRTSNSKSMHNTPYQNQHLNSSYQSISLSLSPQIQSNRKFIPRHINHDRQRSELIISELRKQIDSINHVIDQSKSLIGSDFGSKKKTNIDNAQVITPRNNQNSSAFIRHSQGTPYTKQQFPIYLNSQESVKYDATTIMKPKVNITISYDQKPSSQLKNNQSYFHNRNTNISFKNQEIRHQSQNSGNFSKLESNYNVKTAKQLQQLRINQLKMEKKATQAESLYQKSRAQNQSLREQIQSLEIRRSLQKQGLQRKIKQLQSCKTRLQSQQAVLIQKNKHTKTLNNLEKTSEKQKVTTQGSPFKPFSHNQKSMRSGSRYYPYNKYRSKSKSNVRYHSPVIDLGSVELSKSEKAKFNNSMQKITFTDNHPYFSDNKTNIVRKSNYKTHNKSNSFNHSVVSANRLRDNKYANEKAKQISSKLLQSRQKRSKGIQAMKYNEQSGKKQQIKRPATNQAYLLDRKREDWPTNYPYTHTKRSPNYTVPIHNCQLSMKTKFQQLILPAKPPSRKQFKDAVLKHYIVGYYLDDNDLDDVYSKVAYGNIPEYEWAVLAMQAVYQKVRTSSQLPKAIY